MLFRSHLGKPVDIPDLFSDKREKQIKAAEVIDAIQEKFGEQALRKGFWLDEK